MGAAAKINGRIKALPTDWQQAAAAASEGEEVGLVIEGRVNSKQQLVWQIWELRHGGHKMARDPV